MPSFCRHGRFEENCPICSRKERAKPGAVSGASGATRRPSPERRAAAPTGKRRTPRGSDLVVRRLARAADDGYDQELVPGLRASSDAVRLAEELAFANARLRELSAAPTGLYAEAGAAQDREEGLWLAFQIAYFGPLEGPDPWTGIEAARVSWAGGELPRLEGLVTGPRSGYDARRAADTFTAYRGRAERGGGQAALFSGEAALGPQRRFDRAVERLALPALGRTPRFEFLLTAGRLGLLEVEPWSLLLGADPTDPTAAAAKRVFGIGEPGLLRERAGELAVEAGVPVAALDLGLVNWARTGEDRLRAGSTAEADPAEIARIRKVLGVAEPVEGDEGGPEQDDAVDADAVAGTNGSAVADAPEVAVAEPVEGLPEEHAAD